LQNRLLGQVKSSRSINRFRILHGRLISVMSAGLNAGMMSLPIASKYRLGMVEVGPRRINSP
jgi:hypothetical protein